jgi:hypothetical protein
MKLLPRIHGTTCAVCHYSVPALGLPPDAELAWFERFEHRPCPNCVGLAVGMVGAFLLASVLGRQP